MTTILMNKTGCSNYKYCEFVHNPVVASMAALNHWPPLPFLARITLSSSLAFLLPMGTPPNALVYEQG
jgi:di/tricarboxylate transporter